MNVYVLMIGNIFFFYLVAVFMNNKALMFGIHRIGRKINSDKDASKSFLFMCFTSIPLILITGLRHSSTGVDYSTYEYIYKYRIKKSSLKEIISNVEPGYGILQKIVGIISDYNIVILMMVIAIMTVLVIYYVYYQYSDILWLSVFLVLTLGSYYVSFNITRQYLVGVLFLLCTKYIYNKKLIKYIISILLLSTIHASAIFMLPMYWILEIKWTSRKNIIINLMILFIAGLCIWNINFVIKIATRLLYASYVDGGYSQSVSLVNLLRPLLFVVIALLNIKKIDFNDRKELCWFNSSLLFLFFYIVSFKFYMLYRFIYYFIPLAILLLTRIINKQTQVNRYLWGMFVVAFALSVGIVGQFNVDYAFFWETQT